jgi:hypothetical protein
MSVEFKTSPEGKLRRSILADRLRGLKQQHPYMNISHYIGFEVHNFTRKRPLLRQGCRRNYRQSGRRAVSGPGTSTEGVANPADAIVTL